VSSSANRGCASAFLRLVERALGLSSDTASALPYRLRRDFVSNAELSFYRVLRSIVGDRLAVCPKVRLGDVLYVPRSRNWWHFHNKISQKHLDFLLCDPATLRPVAAIELDDASHASTKRARRDAFLEQALAVAGLPLVRYPVRHAYRARDIAEPLAPLIELFYAPTGDTDAGARQSHDTSFDHGTKDRTGSPAGIPTVAVAPICSCGATMVLRTASRGRHMGERFWGCPNYPACQEIRPVHEAATDNHPQYGRATREEPQ